MQYLDKNILCLLYEELVPAIMAKGTYDQNKARKNITVHGLGGNGRKVFIEFESLPPKYKSLVVEKYGNPYEYMAKQPILDLIEWDLEAYQFYSDFVLPNGSMLPNTFHDAKGKPQINYVDRYTKANNWLNMIHQLTNDKRALKDKLNLSVTDFWDTICDLIIKQDIAIPSNPKRLKEKVKIFKQITERNERYKSLIKINQFGNNRSAKIKGEESEAVLLKLLSDGRMMDNTVVTAGYNLWAKNNGLPAVSVGAVGYFARNNEHIIAPLRDGLKRASNKYSKDIQRERASAPLLFINADDNCLDLFFEVEKIKSDGKMQKSKHYRPMLYVIIDTYNDYILGYAVGNTVTHELVYAAFRNAIQHIAELTGAYYLPHQLQTDRWGLDVKYKNELGQFYSKVAKFTPQQYGVPQGKYIERSFGTEWHQVLKVMPDKHYAGKNITAKERLSAEYVIEASKNYPSIERMPEIVANFINVMRLKPNPKTGVSRQQEWVEGFNQSEKSKAKAIDATLKLQIFGKKYPHAATITKQGLKPVINGQKLTLDIPDNIIWKHNGKKVDIIYDPENLNEMMVTDNEGLRFIANQYSKVPAALADYKEGDAKRIHSLFEAKKDINKLMVNTIQDRMKVLGDDFNAQSFLQAGVIVKDLKNGAEEAYLENLYQLKSIAPPIKQIQKTEEINTVDDEEMDVRGLY